MSRLLRANLARLWKSKIIWICTILVTAWEINLIYMDGEDYMWYMIAQMFFFCNKAVIIAGALFTGVFIGTEYGDGTIRNKLAAGYSRRAVYFANFFTCLIASLIMWFVWLATVLLTGGYSLLQGERGNYFPVERTPLYLAGSLVALAAQIAVFVFISMMIRKKLIGIAAVTVAAAAFLYLPVKIQTRLEEAEYIGGILIDIDKSREGDEIFTPDTKNPKYLTGTKRRIYEYVYRVLPCCQLYQIGELNHYYYFRMNLYSHLDRIADNENNPLEYAKSFPFYSACIFVFVNSGGIFLFRRKDLK